MHHKGLSYQKVKKKYLNFLKSQEVLSEPFRDKIRQLNNFYIPISQMIYKSYLKDKKTKIIALKLTKRDYDEILQQEAVVRKVQRLKMLQRHAIFQEWKSFKLIDFNDHFNELTLRSN